MLVLVLNYLQEDQNPIENEEWVVFLRKTIAEVMGGELTSLWQPSLTNIIVSPLRNSGANPKVLSYVASVLAIPFVIPETREDVLKQIKTVLTYKNNNKLG